MSRITGQVRIVGAGLLGASIGHALVSRGVDVILDDASRASRSLAVDYGAGRVPAAGDNPGLVIVAVPPDATAEVIAAELVAWPQATVTDVASVKAGILAELHDAGADLSRYVGGHPLAGRERGGAISARADLFIGRPWVITGGAGGSGGAGGAGGSGGAVGASSAGGSGSAGGAGGAERRRLVEDLVIELGAIPVSMSAEEHDASVALVSHVPQVVSSLLAARLAGASDPTVGLAGQGLRDTTRIASSDPELWVQILGANAAPVVQILERYRADLDAMIAALGSPEAPGARRQVAELLSGGNVGVARIPGKHGLKKTFSQLIVRVNDEPGQLARLLTDVGEVGVNMEDLRLEHSPGAQFGLAEISVVPEAEARLAEELVARGWTLAGASE